MLQHFTQAQDGHIYQADICIIGAGVAGITLARDLMKTGKKILLLESGGADYRQDVQDLAKGQNTGFSYYDLDEARLRFFGGTTAIWGGRVAQLDEIDFQKRDWVKDSGWPFGKDVLRPYYVMAQALLGLDPVADNGVPGGFHTDLNADLIKPAFWQFDEVHDRFTLRKCKDLVDAPNVEIVLNATAVNFGVHGDGGKIIGLLIKDLSGAAAQVRAGQYILATGGLEVPRLLLSSQSSAHPQGLGNNYDLVGRYFMEHPHARAGRVHVSDPKALFAKLPRFKRYKGARYGMLFRPGEALQQAEGILNTGFTLAVRKHPGQAQVAYKQLYNKMRHDLNPTKIGRGLWKMTRRASVMVQDRWGAALNAKKLSKEGYGLYVAMRAEQAPNYDSRVVLGTQEDALGMRQIELDWRFSEIDKRSVAVSMAALGREFERLGLGQVETQPWLTDESAAWEIDPLISNHPIGGYHHMGGTRMADDPQRGVVDADCRVHGIENLYIAGSSVFPTGGWANPTLSIMALALRLADKLKQAS